MTIVHAIRNEVREIRASGPGVIRTGPGRPPRLNGVFRSVKKGLAAKIRQLESKQAKLGRSIAKLREAAALLDANFPTA